MNTQTQTSQNLYAKLYAKLYEVVRLRHGDLKELSDLWLTITNFVDVVKKTMSQSWYDAHRDMTLHEFLINRLVWSDKAVFHCREFVFQPSSFVTCVERKKNEILNDVLSDPKHDLIIELLIDLLNYMPEDLTLRELETIATIINDIINYCETRGYSPDDLIDDCLSK